jgi:ASC-1-like (ASCH) protein
MAKAVGSPKKLRGKNFSEEYQHLNDRYMATGFSMFGMADTKDDPRMKQMKQELDQLIALARHFQIGYVVYLYEFPEGVLTEEQTKRFFGAEDHFYNKIILSPNAELTVKDMAIIEKYSAPPSVKAPARHDLSVSQPWGDAIIKGDKVWEGRALKSKGEETKYQRDDVLNICLNDAPKMNVTRTIGQVLQFSTFGEALAQLGLRNILPGTKTIAEGEAIYKQWYPETPFGVVMLELLHV